MRRSIVVIAVGVLAGSSAHAEIVHFVNPPPGEPGHFNWSANWNGIFLDITAPAAGQTNQITDTSFGQGLGFDQLSVFGVVMTYGRGAAIAATSFDESLTLDLEQGDPLGGLTYLDYTYFSYPFGNPPEWISPFPEGVTRYVGVLIEGDKFGWIEVCRKGPLFAATSWAYQTVPGAPLFAGQVPAPGGTVLLGTAVFGALPRRRRP